MPQGAASLQSKRQVSDILTVAEEGSPAKCHKSRMCEVKDSPKSDVAIEEAYWRDGCVFPVRGLLKAEEVDKAEGLLMRLVEERPSVFPAEDLLNLHMTIPALFELCRLPAMVAIAQRLLRTPDVSVFSSRIACKLPGVGKEIPWHQDSLYWPLIPPGSDRVAPQVASVWLALDDVNEENGYMEVLPFEACPESKGRNAEELLVFNKTTDFNITLDVNLLKTDQAKRVHLQKGEAEWHSAWTIHKSHPNRSRHRRLAWIVRYCPTGTRVKAGIRSSSCEIIPIAGASAASPPTCSSADVYWPCAGNSVLK